MLPDYLRLPPLPKFIWDGLLLGFYSLLIDRLLFYIWYGSLWLTWVFPESARDSMVEFPPPPPVKKWKQRSPRQWWKWQIPMIATKKFKKMLFMRLLIRQIINSDDISHFTSFVDIFFISSHLNLNFIYNSRSFFSLIWNYSFQFHQFPIDWRNERNRRENNERLSTLSSSFIKDLASSRSPRDLAQLIRYFKSQSDLFYKKTMTVYKYETVYRIFDMDFVCPWSFKIFVDLTTQELQEAIVGLRINY